MSSILSFAGMFIDDHHGRPRPEGGFLFAPQAPSDLEAAPVVMPFGRAHDPPAGENVGTDVVLVDDLEAGDGVVAADRKVRTAPLPPTVHVRPGPGDEQVLVSVVPYHQEVRPMRQHPIQTDVVDLNVEVTGVRGALAELQDSL